MENFLNLKDGQITKNSYRFTGAEVTTLSDLLKAWQNETQETLTVSIDLYDENLDLPGNFSLMKKINVDDYFDYAEFQNDNWIDTTTKKVICKSGLFIESILNFENNQPVSTSYCFTDGQGTAWDSTEDDLQGVIDLWISLD